MTKRNICVSCCIVFILAKTAFGQGLNNNVQFDSLDTRKIFSLLGVEVFKFPFSPLANNKDNLFVNLIIKEFKNNELISTANSLASLKKFYTGDKKVFLSNMASHLKNGEWMRFYFHKLSKRLDATIGTKYREDQLSFDLIPEETSTSILRAFSNVEIKLDTTTPCVVFYANGIGKPFMECPEDSTPEQIAKLYDHVLIFYVELVDLNRIMQEK